MATASVSRTNAGPSEKHAKNATRPPMPGANDASARSASAPLSPSRARSAQSRSAQQRVSVARVRYNGRVPRLCFVTLCGAAISVASIGSAQPLGSPPSQPAPLAPTERPTPSAQALPAIDGTLRFSWVRAGGAEQCPGPSAITDAVESRLARAVFSSSAAQSIEAIVARRDNQWTVELYLRNFDGALLGSRTLTSARPECEAAVDAAVFAITLVIDPDAAPTASSLDAQNAMVARAASRAALGIARAVTETPERPRSTPPAQPAPPPRVDVGAVSLSAWALFGALPALSTGAALHGYARVYRRFGLRSWLRFLPEQRADSAAIGAVSFGLSTVTLSADVELVDLSRFALSVAIGPTIGAIHAVLLERPSAESGQRAFFSVSTAAIGAVRLVGPLALDLGIEGTIPVTRYRFGLDSSTTQGMTVYSPVFEQPWLVAGAWIALSARFR